MAKILVAGASGLVNSGDETILEVLLATLRARQDEIKVMSFNPEFTATYHQVESISNSPRNFAEWVRAVQWCDCLIMGGGCLFQDQSSAMNIPFWATILLLSKMLKKQTYLYANSIGPVNSRLGKLLLKNALRNVDVVSLRDKASYDLLERLGCKPKKCLVTADPVFSWSAVADIGQEIIPKPYIVIALRHWYDMHPLLSAKLARKLHYRSIDDRKKYRRLIVEFAGALLYMVHDLKFHPCFISMFPGRDEEIVHDIIIESKIQDYTHLSQFMPSAKWMGIIRGAELVLGMRLHAVIYAIKQGKAFISINYSSKSRELLSYLGLENLGIDVDNFTAEYFIEKMVMINADCGYWHDKIMNADLQMVVREQKNALLLDNLLNSRKEY